MTIDVTRHKLFARFRNTVLATSIFALAACGNGSGSNNSAGEPALPDETSQEQVVDTSTNQTASTVDEAAQEKLTEAAVSDRASILAKYSYLDPNRVVPTQALADAVVYWYQNKAKFNNVNYITIINFAQNSKEKRFYMVDMNSGSVWALHTAHGKGSDPDFDGYATMFSNTSGSNMSSLGFYRTAETYTGTHGLSMRLDGLSTTNSNARARAIVVHGAAYVQESNVIQGRSWGCPALSMSYYKTVINALKNGSLIYAVVDKGGTSRDWGSATSVTPTPTPTPSPSPSPAPSTGTGTYNMVPLSWETSSHPERTAWSDYLMTLVLNDWSSLLKGSTDMASFCPNYSNLNNTQRANVWAQLFSAVAKYESGYSPTSRYQETTMGTDPVTGKPVYSEGLLQLSYQDIQPYSFCKFDWSKDKYLSATDPKKTILDPYINLHCGVGIMANQIAKRGAIGLSSGVYWSTLKVGGTYSQLTNIKAMVKSLSICK